MAFMAQTEGARYFPALHNRDFRLLWIGQVISFSGTWMHATAQGWLVYSLTKSPLYLGIVSATAALPIMLFSLLGGAVADRFRKRNLLMLTQALSILPALAIGVLTQLGIIRVWEVILLVFLFGLINAFDVPARQSFYAELVERDTLQSAVALNSVAFNGARVSGPVIAGLTIAWVGLPACFYLNALSFLAVVLALYKINARQEEAAQAPKKSLAKEISEGMRFVGKEPAIRATLSMVGLFSLFAIPFITLLPVFAVKVLDSGPGGFGFLMGSAGAGALVGALGLAMRSVPGTRTSSLMRSSSIVFPVALLFFSLSKNFYLSASCLVMAGWGLISFLALANSSIQLKTSDVLRGRVMSVYTLVFLGLAPMGNLLMGWAAQLFGTPRTLAVASALCIGLGLLIGRRLEGRQT
ncbi:MAG: MFS transporter [Nitrospiraceae bacterium]|nr:MFS transporter [Nitrospiraceae bacterium]